MPRLTNRDYLAQRHFLTKLWSLDDGGAFAVLPGHAQRDVHDFYAPTVLMTDEYAATHRTRIKAFPSLPQSAGRAFEALRANLEGRQNQIVDRHLANTTNTIKVGRKTRQIRVTGVSRSDIDIDALARALVRLSKEDVDGKLLKLAQKRARRK